VDSIIFDLDGTLWDSRENVCKAWNQVIKSCPYAKGTVTVEDLKKVMGLQIPEIAKVLFGYLDEGRQLALIRECCEAENQFLRKKGGKLYPHLELVLAELSKKHKLFIVSNCQDGYIEAFFEFHRLEKYFQDYEHPGRTGLAKGKNIRLIMERNELTSPVYVGDTQGDCDAAACAGIPFVYAAYGFGEAKNGDYRIEQLADLLSLPLFASHE
jgi:phosphoglycolate phosphatase